MLKNQEIKQVIMQWKHLEPNEATWEIVDHLRAMSFIVFQ